jgi:hypothetical protein
MKEPHVMRWWRNSEWVQGAVVSIVHVRVAWLVHCYGK